VLQPLAKGGKYVKIFYIGRNIISSGLVFALISCSTSGPFHSELTEQDEQQVADDIARLYLTRQHPSEEGCQSAMNIALKSLGTLKELSTSYLRLYCTTEGKMSERIADTLPSKRAHPNNNEKSYKQKIDEIVPLSFGWQNISSAWIRKWFIESSHVYKYDTKALAEFVRLEPKTFEQRLKLIYGLKQCHRIQVPVTDFCSELITLAYQISPSLIYDRWKQKNQIIAIVEHAAAQATTSSRASATQTNTQVKSSQSRQDTHSLFIEFLLHTANDYTDRRHFPSALRVFGRLLADQTLKPLQRYSAFSGLASALKISQNKPAEIKTLKRWKSWSEEQFKSANLVESKYYESVVRYARAVWTEGQWSLAHNTFAKLLKEISSSEMQAELNWLLAKMYEEKSQINTATKYFAQAQGQVNKASKNFEKFNWSYAKSLSRQGRFGESLEISKVASQELEKAKMNASKWKFWSAIWRKKNDSQADILSDLNQVYKEDPQGYYGLVALHVSLNDQHESGSEGPNTGRTELRSKDKNVDTDTLLGFEKKSLLPSLPSPLLERTGRSAQRKVGSVEVLERVPSALQTLRILIKSKAPEWAQQEMKQYLDDHPARLDKESLDLFKLLYASGNFKDLIYTLNRLEPEERNKLFVENPDLFYPAPFHDDVHDAAARFKVDPALIYSIIRQESAFDPNAKSGAHAYGLMQILPTEAKKISRAYTLGLKSDNQLFEPSKNLLIGTAFLKTLLRRHKFDPIATICSYNASQDAYRGWIKSRFKGDWLEFIEDIPYDETRLYLQLVLRNHMIYGGKLPSGAERILASTTYQ